jgi:hypothetical protein
MTRVDGWYTTMQRWMLVPVATLMLVACSRGEQKGGPKNDSVVVAAVAPSRSAILTEATTNYTYASDRTPIPVDSNLFSAPGGPLPVITISTATQVSGAGRLPGHVFTYRLKSSGPYQAMGIAPGLNYVWRDTSTGPEGPYRLLVVPADSTYPMMWLKRDTNVASYVPGPAPEPRLVKSARGYGTCDNRCTPHCVSSGTLRAFTTSDTLQIATGG